MSSRTHLNAIRITRQVSERPPLQSVSLAQTISKSLSHSHPMLFSSIDLSSPKELLIKKLLLLWGFFFFLVTCILTIRRHLFHKYCVILFKEFKIFLINTFLQRDISKPKYRKKRIIMVYKTGPQSNFFIFIF